MTERIDVGRIVSVASGVLLTVGGLGAAAMSARYGVEAAVMQPQMEMFESLRAAEKYIALATGAAGVAFAGAGISIAQAGLQGERL